MYSDLIIYIFFQSLQQAKYEFFEKVLRNVDGVEYFQISEHEEVLSLSVAKPNSIFIFDDIACEKQDNVRAFFCMGRHVSFQCFYLCQTHARIPKNLVRDNFNLLVLFRPLNILVLRAALFSRFVLA